MRKILQLMVIVFWPVLALSSMNADQKSYLKKAQSYLDDPSAGEGYYTKSMCGFNIPTKLDEALAEPFMKADAELKNYCEEVRSKIALICRDGSDELKNRVKKNIKRITCKLAPTVDGVSFRFVEGNLEAFFNTKSSDLSRGVL